MVERFLKNKFLYKNLYRMKFSLYYLKMTSEITKRIDDRKVDFTPYQWESGCIGLYHSVKSYSDLREFILR